MGKEDTFFREVLALERTVLANERTYLAWIRTSLTFFITGITLIKFFDMFIAFILGYVFMPVSVVCLFIGTYKYKENARKYRSEKYKLEVMMKKR